MAGRSLVPDEPPPIRQVDRQSSTEHRPGEVRATDDHEVIREWAARHGAEPATGEATPSGPATLDVQDGGAGIRFNFPAASQFRPIGWDEWLRNFTEHDLMFVYEDESPGGYTSTKYRLVPRQNLQRQAKLL